MKPYWRMIRITHVKNQIVHKKNVLHLELVNSSSDSVTRELIGQEVSFVQLSKSNKCKLFKNDIYFYQSMI
jgi:hypothetical protein